MKTEVYSGQFAITQFITNHALLPVQPATLYVEYTQR